MSTTGIFGKLPCYGDFLSRDLNTHFVDVWDAWLQGYVSGTQEQLGESWLDIYLTSPIWRFAFSSGVIDENNWAGIVLPSVDRVGRYFPFSIAKNIGALPPPVAMSAASAWYNNIEDIALQALEGETSVDEILEMVNAVELSSDSMYGTYAPTESLGGAIISMPFESESVASVFPQLLHHTLTQSQQSYSLWSTRGSELVEPCVFFGKALPSASSAAAMLDGNWEASNWARPFPLSAMKNENENEGEMSGLGVYDE